jgi:guanylate kinase
MARPIVIVGPSGVGKSTLIDRLMREHPTRFGFSVSHTSRAPRQGETDGVQYHFISRQDFVTRVQDGYFVEHVEYSGNLYGTSRTAVQDVHDRNKICILIIDIQGMLIFKQMPEFRGARYVFIAPPSFDELKRRMLSRSDQIKSESELALRLETAQRELEYRNRGGGFWDLVMVNDDLERAYEQLKHFCLQ